MFGCQYFKGRHFEGRGLINYVLPRAEVDAKAMKVKGHPELDSVIRRDYREGWEVEV